MNPSSFNVCITVCLFSEDIYVTFNTVKHLLSAVSKFNGLKKMTYWHMLNLVVLMYHSSSYATMYSLEGRYLKNLKYSSNTPFNLNLYYAVHM